MSRLFVFVGGSLGPWRVVRIEPIAGPPLEQVERDYAELEKMINRKLRKVGPSYGIRNLYRTPQGRYRFEMKVSVDPRDEAKLHQIVRAVLRELPGDRPVQAKYYLPESLVERVKAQAEKKGVSQSALVAECLAESL